MAILRNTPYPGMNFLVDLGGGDAHGPEAGLAEVILPEARVHVLEYRNGNERQPEVRKLQTTTRYGNLILRRGAIGSLSWYEWWQAVRQGDQSAVRTIAVHLLAEDQDGPVLTWKFVNARPVSHRFSPLNALGAEPFMETLEIAFERLEMQ
jgi:phage tail-like protein